LVRPRRGFTADSLAGVTLHIAGDQTHVIVFPAAYVAHRKVFPFLIRKDGRDVLALHVHRATVYAVDRALVDNSFVVKALHRTIALSCSFALMVIPGPL